MTTQIKTLILDAGHGSLNPINGEDSEALTRKYVFPENNHTVYEGVINRLYTKSIKTIAEANGFYVVETAPDYTDQSLQKRVQIANNQNQNTSYLLSIHCNASSSHTATGLEGFTSPGQNGSDAVMESILQTIKSNNRYNTKIRTNTTDGDLDKEAKFTILTRPLCRTGLMEIDFYDNWKSYTKLIDDNHIEWMSKSIVKGLVSYNNGLY